MFGWLTILKTVLGISGKIFGKFKQQKYVEKVNEIKRLNFKIRQRELEREALKKADEEISNHRDYLNKS
jgi:ribonucleotide reductase alpha subunit